MAISAESTAGGEPAPKSWWLYLLLGIVLVIGGFFVLGDVTLASVISAIVIAWALVIVGVYPGGPRLQRDGMERLRSRSPGRRPLHCGRATSFWPIPWRRRSS